MADLSSFKSYADLLNQVNQSRQSRISAADPFGQGAQDGFDPNNFSTKIGNQFFSAGYSPDGSNLDSLSTGTYNDKQNFRLGANPDGSIAQSAYSPSGKNDYSLFLGALAALGGPLAAGGVFGGLGADATLGGALDAQGFATNPLASVFAPTATETAIDTGISTLEMTGASEAAFNALPYVAGAAATLPFVLPGGSSPTTPSPGPTPPDSTPPDPTPPGTVPPPVVPPPGSNPPADPNAPKDPNAPPGSTPPVTFPVPPIKDILPFVTPFVPKIIDTLTGPKNPQTGTGTAPPSYQLSNQSGMDASFNSNFQAYQNSLNQYKDKMQPFMDQNFQNQYNNPQNAGFMAGANNAGAAYGRASQSAGQMAGQIQGAGQQNYNQSLGNAQSLFNAGDAAYQTGLDPRKAIYNQNVGDLTENIRAGEYARGIQMSPSGASVEANALGRFQNDWQNQQQQRQNAGLGAMQGAYGQGSSIANNGLSGYGRSMSEGLGMQQQSAQFAGLAGSVPYDAQNQINGQQQGAIGNYFSGLQPYLQGNNQLQSNSLGYMNHAQGAQNQAFNQNMQTQQFQNQQAQQLAPLFNQAAQGIGNWWSGFNAPQTAATNPFTTSNQFTGGADGYTGSDGYSFGT